MRIPIFGYSTLAAMAATMAFAAEPIRWFNGVWDDTGAPQGKLLTDNSGWLGERVWTRERPWDPLDAQGRQAAEGQIGIISNNLQKQRDGKAKL